MIASVFKELKSDEFLFEEKPAANIDDHHHYPDSGDGGPDIARCVKVSVEKRRGM